MSSDFNPLLWFICRHCRRAFSDTDKLKKHKIRKHFQDCSTVKCIVFEERLLAKPWIPTNTLYPEVAPGFFVHKNELEMSPQKNDRNCKCRISSASVSVQTEELNSLPSPEPQQKPKLKPTSVLLEKRPISSTSCSDDLNSVPVLVSKALAGPYWSDPVQDENRPSILTSERGPKPNPYVVVKRLTRAELNFYSKGNSCGTLRKPRSILNQNLRSKKRSYKCLNSKLHTAVNLDSEDIKIPDIAEISKVQFGKTLAGLNSKLEPVANTGPTDGFGANNCAKGQCQVESEYEGIKIISVASHPQYFEDPLKTEASADFLPPDSGKNYSSLHKRSLQDFCKRKALNTKLSRESLTTAAAQAKRNNERSGPNADTITCRTARTFSYISEIVNFYRQFRSPDGAKNIILLDPDPGPNDYCEISSENHITCRLCLKKWTTPIALCNHARNCWLQNKERHRFCVSCETTFEGPRELLEHNRVEHPDKLRAAFKCKACLQEYFDEAVFEQHEEAHKDPNFLPFTCSLEDCDLSFNDGRRFEKHISDHRDKLKRYRCRLCHKPFQNLENLTDHMKSHTGERAFKCQVGNCGASFTTKYSLTQHNNHRHSAELGLSQNHLCSTCGKAFVTLSMLKEHTKRSHVKARVHNCSHEGCSKAFVLKTQLTEHERDHTGEKPFQCESCGQTFAKLWTFVKHKRSHEGTLNRATCHLCPRKFLGTWELKQHLTKVHEGAAQKDNRGSLDSD